MTTVLAVDDDDLVREIVLAAVRSIGVEAIGAASVAEARRALDNADIDVVMPKTLGKAVAEEVMARRPDIRVLFMSGYAHPVLASQGRLDEGVHLLAKPFSAEQLELKIREVLDS